MSKWHLRLLRRLVSKILIAGRLDALMQMVWDEHRRLFYEDNEPTRRAHILEEAERAGAHYYQVHYVLVPKASS